MALIECPEYGVSVSNQAVSCTKCAYPINNSYLNVKVTEVQNTKKKYKIHLTIAKNLLYLGLFSFLFTFIPEEIIYKYPALALWPITFVLLPISIVYLITVRILIWWNHA